MRYGIEKSNEQIIDARERLSNMVVTPNYVKYQALALLITGLGAASIPNVDAAIAKAETSKQIVDDLLILLKAEKRRKELEIQVRICLIVSNLI